MRSLKSVKKAMLKSKEKEEEIMQVIASHVSDEG